MVAIIGDGALTGGMAWEALNNIAAAKDSRLVMIVNDNGWSYQPTIGGLAEHLAAEDLRAADVAAHAAEQIDLELFELEQAQQLGKAGMHQAVATPRRFCMAGLVVVYCRNCFLAGYR